MVKWYDADMGNSKCQAAHKKQMDKDLAELYKELKVPKESVIEDFEDWHIVNNYTSIAYEDFENGGW